MPSKGRPRHPRRHHTSGQTSMTASPGCIPTILPRTACPSRSKRTSAYRARFFADEAEKRDDLFLCGRRGERSRRYDASPSGRRVFAWPDCYKLLQEEELNVLMLSFKGTECSRSSRLSTTRSVQNRPACLFATDLRSLRKQQCEHTSAL